MRALILPESERIIATRTDPYDVSSAAVRGRALADDYLRTTRLALSVATWAITTMAIFWAISLFDYVILQGGTDGWLPFIASTVLAVAGIAVAALIARTGGALTRAAKALLRSRYEANLEDRTILTNAYAHVGLFSPRTFIRLTTSSLAMLFGLLATFAVLAPVGTPWLRGAIAAAGLFSLSCGIAQMVSLTRLHLGQTT